MTSKVKAPIFDMYTIDDLSKRLCLSKRYLCDLEDGKKPMGRRFRRMCVLATGRTEAELFGPDPDFSGE